MFESITEGEKGKVDKNEKKGMEMELKMWKI